MFYQDNYGAMRIIKVDYKNQEQGKDLLFMLNHYAMHEQGGGEPISEYVNENLLSALAKSPIAVSFLAYEGREVVGLANCFFGFSTFAAKPLLNVHDLAVRDGFRGKGIGTKLLNRVEEEAKSTGCCKITLEVLEQNTRARQVYQKFGFEGYNFGEESNNALFWQKKI